MESSEDTTRTYRFKECDLCVADDDKILVSISPRRLSLPPPSERKTKMEIRNNNPYPIYFKAGTSNMDAFRPQPNAGRIPPKSKASVVVQFFNSVTPIRRHEEVVVVTSLRPFQQYALYDCSICPYCCESLEASKHHQAKNFYSSGQDEYHGCNGAKTLNNGFLEKKDSQNSKQRATEKKYAPPPKTETEATEYVLRNMATPSTRTSGSDEQSDNQKNDLRLKNLTHGGDKLELEEICLHAFVHRPTTGGCGCNNCFEMSSGDKVQKKTKEIHQVTAQIERRLSDPTPSVTAGIDKELLTVPEKKEAKLAKDVTKMSERMCLAAEDLKDRVKAAHILARIVKAGETLDISDTDTSDMSSKDDKVFKKRTKIISEDDFMKKLEKAKFKKHQKQLEDESKSTTTTEVTADAELEKTTDKEHSKVKPAKKGRRWSSLHAKCDTILNLTWTNFYLLLVLLIVTVGLVLFFCTSAAPNANCAQFSKPNEFYPCFFHYFR